MRLAELNPTLISSVLHRTWLADVPVWIVAALIAGPPLILRWPYAILYLIPAVAAGGVVDWAMSRVRHRLRVKNALRSPESLPTPAPFDFAERAAFWKELLQGSEGKSLVLFSFGTCVVLNRASDDPVADAKKLLSEFGHSVPGTPSANMLVYDLTPSDDFVIGGHHPGILTFVPGAAFRKRHVSGRAEAVAAFLGRALRVLDTFSRDVVHVESLA